MSTFTSLQSGSRIAVDPSDRTALSSFSLDKAPPRDPGSTGRVPAAVASFQQIAESPPHRALGRRLQAEAGPVRVLTSMDSSGSLSESAELRQPSQVAPQRVPGETFARLYIFDWDNTLCPTDWLCELYSRCGQSFYTAKRPCAALCSPVIKNRLAVLESSVRRLLQKCTERGQVTILSNATSIGLLKTLRILPLVQRTLTELKVQVVSARDMCEPRGLPLEKWKDTALIRLVAAFINKRPQQKHSIMTIGDQPLEHIALHNAANHLQLSCGWECHPKCIKYVESPSLEALTRQTLFLTELLDRLADEESGTFCMQLTDVFSGDALPPARC
ncbi:uncharacterized protein EMH_0009090 [Eimeria mitis]|uniref:Uncharacterized protein n=1 Tax=Eimeria mitis TaxID=44415 RepID=U6K143_9EIME|nr:uncharacterized protein EMH_0009090 [Eimeria mitis]CDJ31445.1 hypothetical protein, conserved [Eimeria mitis]